MKLILVHQILIGTAFGLAVLFGLRSIVLFTREGGVTHLALGAASITIAVGLGLYYRKVKARRLAGRDSIALP